MDLQPISHGKQIAATSWFSKIQAAQIHLKYRFLKLQSIRNVQKLFRLKDYSHFWVDFIIFKLQSNVLISLLELSIALLDVLKAKPFYFVDRCGGLGHLRTFHLMETPSVSASSNNSDVRFSRYHIHRCCILLSWYHRVVDAPWDWCGSGAIVDDADCAKC